MLTSLTRFRAHVLCALALAAVLALTACSTGESTASSGTGSSGSTSESNTSTETITFMDDLNREVNVKLKPQRVVAGIGSFADMWQLAGGTLVGAPDEAFTDYDIDSTTVKSIGAFASINQESIMELNPDFVILTGASTGQAGAVSQTDLAEGLEAAGASVAYFKVTTFDDYLRVLQTLCTITGRADLFEQNGTQVKANVDKTLATYGPAAQGKTFMLGITYSQGVRVQRSSSQTGAMLNELGAVNIADQNQGILTEFSVESLLEINPDYLFIIPMGNDEAASAAALDKLTSQAAWASLKAVEEGHAATLPRDLYVNKPNARWDEAHEMPGTAFH